MGYKVGDLIYMPYGGTGTIVDIIPAMSNSQKETLYVVETHSGWSKLNYSAKELDQMNPGMAKCTCGMAKALPDWARGGSHSSWCDAYQFFNKKD